MLGLLFPFGRVKSGESHFLLGYPYPVADGHISLARDCAGGALDLASGLGFRDG